MICDLDGDFKRDCKVTKGNLLLIYVYFISDIISNICLTKFFYKNVSEQILSQHRNHVTCTA